MKTAILTLDGILQVVLTPETDHERAVIGQVGGNIEGVEIFRGSFYDCQGGYTRLQEDPRQSIALSDLMDRRGGSGDDRSLIIRLKE